MRRWGITTIFGTALSVSACATLGVDGQEAGAFAASTAARAATWLHLAEKPRQQPASLTGQRPSAEATRPLPVRDS